VWALERVALQESELHNTGCTTVNSETGGSHLKYWKVVAVGYWMWQDCKRWERGVD
jgi:hypothetical protein